MTSQTEARSTQVIRWIARLLPIPLVLFMVVMNLAPDPVTGELSRAVTVPQVVLALFFPAEERAAAELVRQACAKSITILRDSWGLKPPQGVRVYVLASGWLRAMFHAAPWHWWPPMVVSMPIWYPRGRRLWRIAGGWQQQLGSRRAVCVKPPRLLAQATSSPGDRLFIREDDPEAKVQQITVHELTHAFTAHLGLPSWLNEGLAMVTTERFAAKPMVRQDSLALLEQHRELEGSLSKQAAKPGGMDAVIGLYARGYWRTRYLEETQPGLLKTLLARPRPPKSWDSAIAAAGNAGSEPFWPTMDAEIVAHFAGQAGPPQESAQVGEVHCE